MKNTKTTPTHKVALTLAWSLCLLLGACSPSDKNTSRSSNVDLLDLTKNTPFYIINGQDVDPTNDSFAQSIVALYDLENNGTCTGSIIDEHYIVTAAHCMPSDPRNLVVLFGTSIEEAAKNKLFIRASDGIAHENFAKLMEQAEKTNQIPDFDWGDIALVEIDQDLPPNYQPMIISDVDPSIANQQTLLAGYGTSDGVKGTGSGFLRKTIVNIDNPSFSKTEVSLNQTKGTGACHGDSGGPAYIQTNEGYLLWGVTSRALKDEKNDCSQYSVYTKIVAYQDWIIKSRQLLFTRTLPPPAAVVASQPNNPPAAEGQDLQAILKAAAY